VDSARLWASVLSILFPGGGRAGALLQVWGFVAHLGVVASLLMLRIIDPKLKAISAEFEQKGAPSRHLDKTRGGARGRFPAVRKISGMVMVRRRRAGPAAA
jgi:hypothetical protein